MIYTLLVDTILEIVPELQSSNTELLYRSLIRTVFTNYHKHYEQEVLEILRETEQ